MSPGRKPCAVSKGPKLLTDYRFEGEALMRNMSQAPLCKVFKKEFFKTLFEKKGYIPIQPYF